MTYEKRLSRCRNTFSADDKGRECVFTDWIPLMVDDLNTLHQNYTIFCLDCQVYWSAFLRGSATRKERKIQDLPLFFGWTIKDSEPKFAPLFKIDSIALAQIPAFCKQNAKVLRGDDRAKREEDTRSPSLFWVDHQGLRT